MASGPGPRDLIPHHRPKIRPSLVRRDGAITLLVMDAAHRLACLDLDERWLAELQLDAALIQEGLARERIEAAADSTKEAPSGALLAQPLG